MPAKAHGGEGIIWHTRLRGTNVFMSFLTFFGFTAGFLYRQNSLTPPPGLGSVYITHYEDSGYRAFDVLAQTRVPYRISGFIDVQRLQAFMLADWIVLAKQMGCGEQSDVIGEGMVFQKAPTIHSPMCVCAYEQFLRHANISNTILGDDVEALEKGLHLNSSLVSSKVTEINGIKRGEYSDSIMRCLTNVRGAPEGRRLGIGGKRFLTLNPFVLIACILGTSCFTSLPQLYRASYVWLGERAASVAWWVAHLLVLGGLMLSFVFTDSGLWGLLLLYTGTLLLDSLLRFIERAFITRVAWTVVRKAGNGKKKKENLLENRTTPDDGSGGTMGATPRKEGAPVIAHVSEELFWIGYIIQLPLLTVLADVAGHRRDATVLGSGILVGISIAILAMALESANRAYLDCTMVRDTVHGAPGGGDDDGGERGVAGPAASLFRLGGTGAYGQRNGVAMVIENVNSRSLDLMWSAGVVLWSVIIGKATMRYFVDAPYLQSTPRDERFMTEFLLFVYTLLPAVDLPHFRLYMPGWGTGSPSLSTVFKNTAERAIFFVLAITWIGFLY